MNTPFNSPLPIETSDLQAGGISLSASDEEIKKDKIRKYGREWKRANREKHNEYNRMGKGSRL